MQVFMRISYLHEKYHDENGLCSAYLSILDIAKLVPYKFLNLTIIECALMLFDLPSKTGNKLVRQHKIKGAIGLIKVQV